MKNIDVLNLEFTSYPSRDRQTATLVCNYLRYMGYNVFEGSVHKGFQLINRKYPKLFFISNTIGAKANVKLVKYAHSKGIKTLSGISEGNMQEASIHQFVWGNKTEQTIHEDRVLHWTERTKNLSIKHFPETASKIKVSGAVGFDVFKISTFISKKNFLEKHNKSAFSRVIGVGCWDFGFFSPQDTRFDIIQKRWTQKEQERFIADGVAFNTIMLETIRNNPDILFVLKEHPGSQGGHKASGIEGCECWDNTVILKKEPIIDCISASDFWLTFESTTVIEAWLLDKQTALINPSGTDFPRANVHLGSPNFKDTNMLQEAIDTFYSTGKLPSFKSLEDDRKQVIKDVIQWDDGLNHVRLGNEIIDLLENGKNAKKQYAALFLFIKQRIIERIAPLFPKRFSYEYKMQQQFNTDEILQFAEKRMSEQVNFYKQQGLTKEDLKQILCI